MVRIALAVVCLAAALNACAQKPKPFVYPAVSTPALSQEKDDAEIKAKTDAISPPYATYLLCLRKALIVFDRSGEPADIVYIGARGYCATERNAYEAAVGSVFRGREAARFIADRDQNERAEAIGFILSHRIAGQ